MKLVFNTNIEINRLKEIYDIVSFFTKAQCINDELEIFSNSRELTEMILQDTNVKS